MSRKNHATARAGLKLKSDAAYIEQTWHDLLLTGKLYKAIQDYMKVRKGMVGKRRIQADKKSAVVIHFGMCRVVPARNIPFQKGLAKGMVKVSLMVPIL
jgi:hypothetical protein